MAAAAAATTPATLAPTATATGCGGAGRFAPPVPPPAATSVPFNPVHVENEVRHFSLVHEAQASEYRHDAHADSHCANWHTICSMAHCLHILVYLSSDAHAVVHAHSLPSDVDVRNAPPHASAHAPA